MIDKDGQGESDTSSKENRTPLILLPGLGADARLFGRQRSAFPELIVPNWIEPKSGESLVDYAARFAKVIDQGQPIFIGGLSFGGVVALEVASHLPTKECFLIGSIRSPAEIPRRLRIFRSISSLIMVLKWVAPMILTYFGNWCSPHVRGTVHQIKDADARFLRWAAGAILRWSPSPGTENVRVFKIHGDRDRVFPIHRTSADRTIAGAGHLLSLTHADEVNEILSERMSKVL